MYTVKAFLCLQSGATVCPQKDLVMVVSLGCMAFRSGNKHMSSAFLVLYGSAMKLLLHSLQEYYLIEK